MNFAEQVEFVWRCALHRDVLKGGGLYKKVDPAEGWTLHWEVLLPTGLTSLIN